MSTAAQPVDLKLASVMAYEVVCRAKCPVLTVRYVREGRVFANRSPQEGPVGLSKYSLICFSHSGPEVRSCFAISSTSASASGIRDVR